MNRAIIIILFLSIKSAVPALNLGEPKGDTAEYSDIRIVHKEVMVTPGEDPTIEIQEVYEIQGDPRDVPVPVWFRHQPRPGYKPDYRVLINGDPIKIELPERDWDFEGYNNPKTDEERERFNHIWDSENIEFDIPFDTGEATIKVSEIQKDLYEFRDDCIFSTSLSAGRGWHNQIEELDVYLIGENLRPRSITTLSPDGYKTPDDNNYEWHFNPVEEGLELYIRFFPKGGFELWSACVIHALGDDEQALVFFNEAISDGCDFVRKKA